MTFDALKIPKLVYESSSPYNKKIEVYKVGDNYRLSVNSIVQSISKNIKSVRGRVWGKMVDFVSGEFPHTQKILLFGLGGATMPHLFKKELPNAHITAVEIDSEMIKVARRFFELDTLDNLTVINEDAMRVISEPEKFGFSKNSFDILIVDIYHGDKYPVLGTSGTFFEGVKWFVREGGTVIFNRIYATKNHQHEVDEFLENVETYFRDVDTVMVAGRSNSDNLLIHGKVL